MKLKWLVIMLATLAFVFVQAGLKVPSVYAESVPIIPPVVNGVVEVSTPTQLIYINVNQAEYQSSTIKLMNNLDMTSAGWGPISKFSGVFDGNGYDISNLRITLMEQDGSNTYMGMFGSTTSTAIIKNLTLSNCNVTGNARNMGAFVGRNYGNILQLASLEEVSIKMVYTLMATYSQVVSRGGQSGLTLELHPAFVIRILPLTYRERVISNLVSN